MTDMLHDSPANEPIQSFALMPAPLPPPLPRARAQNFIARHWRGEYPLGRSWWVNHLALGISVGCALAALSAFINEHAVEQPVRWLISLALSWGGIVLFSIWAVVGVWRAATAYARDGKRFWGGAVEGAGTPSCPRFFSRLAILRPPQAGCSTRTESTACSVPAALRAGELCGRRDCSWSPAIPAVRQRSSHL